MVGGSIGTRCVAAGRLDPERYIEIQAEPSCTACCSLMHNKLAQPPLAALPQHAMKPWIKWAIAGLLALLVAGVRYAHCPSAKPADAVARANTAPAANGHQLPASDLWTAKTRI